MKSFFNAAILSRVWEWSGSGTNTQLRTRLLSAAVTVSFEPYNTVTGLIDQHTTVLAGFPQ